MPKVIIPSKLASVQIPHSLIQTLICWVICLIACLLTILLAESGNMALALPVNQSEITVYRDPYCGCCHKWMTHLEKSGFQVKDIETEDMTAIKQQNAVPPELASCHTAVIDRYVVEGHVPATEIQRLLKDQLDVAGIVVPHMPAGSPGMEMEGRQDPFSVLTFDVNGQTQVLRSYP